MSGQVPQLRAGLGEPDRQVLELLAITRLASSTQIRRLVIEPSLTPAEASNGAAARANRRLLTRLVRQRLIRRLARRIGGPGGGSAAPLYVLSALGQRVAGGDRPLMREPSWQLLAHTLAISEVVVTAHVLEALGEIVLREVTVEPAAWRRWPGPSGLPETLKPDGFIVLERDGFLEAWFIEADLGTERARVISTKAARYQRYRMSGREQTALGLFPRVLWSVPDHARVAELEAVFAHLPEAERALHVVTRSADVGDALVGRDPGTGRPRPPP